ncbi:MAG: hypothetical protein V3R29_01975 [Candidatus Acidoferrales bacterium]
MAAPKETPKPLSSRSFSPEILERLRGVSFECTSISSNPERIRVMKQGCAALFERQAEGSLRLAQPPGYVIRGEIGRLWDAGYQKFWLLGPPTEEPFQEPRRPALAEQLRALHRFSEELRSRLGVPSFYNESIGSTSEITAYDRVEGRGPAARQRLC